MSEDQDKYHKYLRDCGYEVLIAEDLRDAREWLIASGFVPASSFS